VSSSVDLVHVLVDALDDEALDRLADRLAPKIEARRMRAEPAPDGWLDSRRAAAYLSLSVNALHKLTSARAIPFEQDGAGCRCWFKRSKLDAWRAGSA
jgi:hypothetical protein